MHQHANNNKNMFSFVPYLEFMVVHITLMLIYVKQQYKYIILG